MARIRTVKPEFFTSEDTCSISPLARLLFIGIWCESDKEGRLPWKPKTLKIRYLPSDDCDIEALCDELVSVGVVKLYGDGLAFVPGFIKHQHVNPRESKSILPAPDGWEKAPYKNPTKDLKDQILNRDNHACVRCGSTENLQIDHILPRSCGGPHVEENLRVLCRHCNAGRPVSGLALQKDLEADGYSLANLRVKFGIDASISELTDREEGKGRERKGKDNPPTPLNSNSRVNSSFPSLDDDGLKTNNIDEIRKAVWRQHGLTEDKIQTKLVSASSEGLRQVRGWLDRKLTAQEILDAIADTYTAAESKGATIGNPWSYLDRVMETVADKRDNPEPEKPKKLSQDEIWRVHMVEFTTRTMRDGKPLWFENIDGPKPGSKGCKVPLSIMAEFGIKPYEEQEEAQTVSKTAPNAARSAEGALGAIRV